jgi:hypothetical protein
MIEDVIGEWRLGKDVEGTGRGLILRYYPIICLEALGKTMKISVTVAGLRAEV